MVFQNEKSQVFSGCHPKEGAQTSGRNQTTWKDPPEHLSQQMVAVTRGVNLLTWETHGHKQQKHTLK